MRIVIVLFFILFGSYLLLSNPAGPKKEQPIRIQVSCGFAGRNSADVLHVKKLVLSKNDSLLTALLFSQDVGLKLLALAAIENISSQRPLILTPLQKEVIADFKKSRQMVKVGEACEGYYSTTVRRLFRKYKNDARLAIDRALLDKHRL